MSGTSLIQIDLASPEDTSAFAARFGRLLRSRDVVGLVGPVGAGKSHFARALIQAAQFEAGQVPEDVPSPTFTLVQSYLAGEQEIWHCDLYRLTDPSEALELGLDAAFETAICLVEWPDRLGDDWPSDRALTCQFEPPRPDQPETYRALTIRGSPDWAERLKDFQP